MQTNISANPALQAAQHAADSIHRILFRFEQARILFATGNSQLQFLQYLTTNSAIPWERVELFHLDEYLGIGIDHPASFARYIRERIIVPAGITNYHLIDGLGPSAETITSLAAAITAAPIHLAFAGIGENGHLAFNDPPADFETEDPYLVVNLDDACRRQQVGEGWFTNLHEVPTQAITISIHQLMQSNEIISVVPDLRKASAVSRCLDGEISPQTPASILRLHPNTTLYLDHESASLLAANTA